MVGAAARVQSLPDELPSSKGQAGPRCPAAGESEPLCPSPVVSLRATSQAVPNRADFFLLLRDCPPNQGSVAAQPPLVTANRRRLDAYRGPSFCGGDAELPLLAWPGASRQSKGWYRGGALARQRSHANRGSGMTLNTTRTSPGPPPDPPSPTWLVRCVRRENSLCRA